MAISASSEFRLWGNFALFTLQFSCYLFFVHWLVGEGSKTSFKVYIAPKCFVDHTTFNLSFFIWCIIYTLYIATTYQSVLYSTPHSIFPILRRISCIKNWKTTSTETEHEFVSLSLITRFLLLQGSPFFKSVPFILALLKKPLTHPTPRKTGNVQIHKALFIKGVSLEELKKCKNC